MSAEGEPSAPSTTAGSPRPSAEREVAATVTPRADGPLVVDGRVSLTAPDGTVTTADRLFLCRCGASADKPFCDGSHKRSGFHADGVVPPRKPTP